MKLILKRNSNYIDSSRKYVVFIDNLDVGNIAQNETLSLDIPNGLHDIQLKIDWGTSRIIRFNGAAEDVIKFECVSSVSGFRIIFAIVYATVFRGRYIHLWQV